jgi:hypothetical protein
MQVAVKNAWCNGFQDVERGVFALRRPESLS